MSSTETKAKTWLEFSIFVPAVDANAWETWFFNIGAEVVTLQDAADQPVYEPQPGETLLWEETEMVGLFSGESDIEHLLAQLQSHCKPLPSPKYKIHYLADEDWSQKWLEFVEPIHVAENFWVTPPKLCAQITDIDAEILQLEPGLAFGTGSHQTTSLCLRAMLAERRRFPDKRVIDYGCGSGILGLTALKLGANHLLATDISQQALQATQQNAALNPGLASKMQLVLPREITASQTGDILLANILANPLIELAATFKRLLTSNGLLILSGLLEADAPRVIEAYQADFELFHRYQQDEWLCLVFNKN